MGATRRLGWRAVLLGCWRTPPPAPSPAVHRRGAAPDDVRDAKANPREHRPHVVARRAADLHHRAAAGACAGANAHAALPHPLAVCLPCTACMRRRLAPPSPVPPHPTTPHPPTAPQVGIVCAGVVSGGGEGAALPAAWYSGVHYHVARSVGSRKVLAEALGELMPLAQPGRAGVAPRPVAFGDAPCNCNFSLPINETAFLAAFKAFDFSESATPPCYLASINMSDCAVSFEGGVPTAADRDAAAALLRRADRHVLDAKYGLALDDAGPASGANARRLACTSLAVVVIGAPWRRRRRPRACCALALGCAGRRQRWQSPTAPPTRRPPLPPPPPPPAVYVRREMSRAMLGARVVMSHALGRCFPRFFAPLFLAYRGYPPVRLRWRMATVLLAVPFLQASVALGVMLAASITAFDPGFSPSAVLVIVDSVAMLFVLEARARARADWRAAHLPAGTTGARGGAAAATRGGGGRGRPRPRRHARPPPRPPPAAQIDNLIGCWVIERVFGESFVDSASAEDQILIDRRHADSAALRRSRRAFPLLARAFGHAYAAVLAFICYLEVGVATLDLTRALLMHGIRTKCARARARAPGCPCFGVRAVRRSAQPAPRTRPLPAASTRQHAPPAARGPTGTTPRSSALLRSSPRRPPRRRPPRLHSTTGRRRRSRRSSWRPAARGASGCRRARAHARRIAHGARPDAPSMRPPHAACSSSRRRARARAPEAALAAHERARPRPRPRTGGRPRRVWRDLLHLCRPAL